MSQYKHDLSCTEKSDLFNFEDKYFVANQGITQSNVKLMRTGDQRGHVNKNIAHD